MLLAEGRPSPGAVRLVTVAVAPWGASESAVTVKEGSSYLLAWSPGPGSLHRLARNWGDGLKKERFLGRVDDFL